MSVEKALVQCKVVGDRPYELSIQGSFFVKFLSSQRFFLKSRRLWDVINIISLTYRILTSEAMNVVSREAGELRQLPALIYNPAG